jgi:hypothetical protein
MIGPVATSRVLVIATAAIAVLLLAPVLVSACGGPLEPDDQPPAACVIVDPPSPPSSPAAVETPVGIVDRQGHSWDITSAVVKYGFDADRFQYGLGAGAIPAIVDPQMVRPVDPTFLAEDEPVIGVVRGDDARAYPLSTLRMHEVANDAIEGMHFAASY